MQQKALKYILIGGVLFIWGLIIYKIIDAAGEDTTPVQSIIKLHIKDTEHEKFTLNADYPDPFLPDTTSLYDSVKLTEISSQTQVQPVEIPKPDLSFIEYHGMINNPLKKVKVALVKLNGREMLVRENEEIGEIEIRKITKDMLSILFKGKSYRVRKNDM